MRTLQQADMQTGFTASLGAPFKVHSQGAVYHNNNNSHHLSFLSQHVIRDYFWGLMHHLPPSGHECWNTGKVVDPHAKFQWNSFLSIYLPDLNIFEFEKTATGYTSKYANAYNYIRVLPQENTGICVCVCVCEHSSGLQTPPLSAVNNMDLKSEAQCTYILK